VSAGVSQAFLVLGLTLASAFPALAQSPPRPDHTVLVIEENHDYSQIIGSASAPYINSLASQGALFTQSAGVTHPSQPNYLHLFSGSAQGVVDDTCPPPGSPYSTPNLGSELLAAGFTFSGYSEGLPSAGSTTCSSGSAPTTYQRKHNPWVNFTNVPASANLRFSDFPAPANYATLPTVSIVVPNQDDDMHDGTIAKGDAWLQTNLDSYVQWAQTHNSLLILTFDENNGASGNHIVTIFVGPMIQPGNNAQPITHHNVLRTVEDLYGLGHAGGAASAAPITGSGLGTPPPVGPAGGGGCGATGMEGLLALSLVWKWNKRRRRCLILRMP
jgi:acid phosphatase